MVVASLASVLAAHKQASDREKVMSSFGDDDAAALRMVDLNGDGIDFAEFLQVPI